MNENDRLKSILRSIRKDNEASQNDIDELTKSIKAAAEAAGLKPDQVTVRQFDREDVTQKLVHTIIHSACKDAIKLCKAMGKGDGETTGMVIYELLCATAAFAASAADGKDEEKAKEDRATLMQSFGMLFDISMKRGKKG